MQSNSISNQSYFAKIQKLHRSLLLQTHNCHFQMRYARGEPWRVIISSDSLLRPSSMITYGQGITAEMACKDALENYEKNINTKRLIYFRSRKNGLTTIQKLLKEGELKHD